MTERARSCGGTLSADRVGDDFVVEALLPHGDSAPDLGRSGGGALGGDTLREAHGATRRAR
ncbi:MAG: hypothetical protein GX555_16770 [Actinomycetales bacterium]|nr:hypothetical protein [Actinomycetales bacterium]